MTERIFAPIPGDIASVGKRVIGCAITVHRLLGPGFKEAMCRRPFSTELEDQELIFEAEKKIIVPYTGRDLKGHTVDLGVEGMLVLELKAVATLLKVHRARLLSYLRASRPRLGYVMNFNQEVLRGGPDAGRPLG